MTCVEIEFGFGFGFEIESEVGGVAGGVRSVGAPAKEEEAFERKIRMDRHRSSTYGCWNPSGAQPSSAITILARKTEAAAGFPGWSGEGERDLMAALSRLRLEREMVRMGAVLARRGIRVGSCEVKLRCEGLLCEEMGGMKRARWQGTPRAVVKNAVTSSEA